MGKISKIWKVMKIVFWIISAVQIIDLIKKWLCKDKDENK